MTTHTEAPVGEASTTGAAGLARALEGALGADYLPARGDQLLAALVHTHADREVLWRLAGLPTSRSYETFEQVVQACELDHSASECPRWYA